MNQQIVVATMAKLAGLSTFLKCVNGDGAQASSGFVIISQAGLEQASATIDECLINLNEQLFSRE